MKIFTDLTVEELRKVYQANQKLQEDVFEDMQETAQLWVDEYLQCWRKNGRYKGIDFCLGNDRGAFFKAEGLIDFLNGLEIAQRDYSFLPDDSNKTIEYVRKLHERFENLNPYDYKNSERLETRIDELISELEDECFKRFQSEYDYGFDDHDCENYFVEAYADCRMEGKSMYVDDEWKLYETMVKCYA